jgi:putative membrane protein
MRRTAFFSIALIAALGVGCERNNRDEARARDASGSPVGTIGEAERDDPSRGDKDFVHDVAIANMAEIEVGKLASERSTNAEVKKFADMMVRDHTSANNKLDTLVRKHNMTLPTEVDEKHRDLRDKLSKLKGAEFDREYMQAMVDGHEAMVDKLGSRIDKKSLGDWEAKYRDLSGKKVEARAEADVVMAEPSDDPIRMSINEWAAQAYPVAYAHREAARTLNETIERRMTQ